MIKTADGGSRWGHVVLEKVGNGHKRCFGLDTDLGLV